MEINSLKNSFQLRNYTIYETKTQSLRRTPATRSNVVILGYFNLDLDFGAMPICKLSRKIAHNNLDFY